MDFALAFGATGTADLIVAGGGYKIENGLATAVALSLFLDRRADADAELDGDGGAFPGGDRRGWAGDEFQATPGDLYGSALWQYRRQKLTPAVISEIHTALLEALEWLTELGIASSVEVELERVAPGRLDIVITITRQAKTPVQFSYVWDATGGLGIG